MTLQFQISLFRDGGNNLWQIWWEQNGTSVSCRSSEGQDWLSGSVPPPAIHTEVVQTWKEKSPVGAWAPAQCLCPSQGHGLQHQITPEAKAPLLLVLVISFLMQSPGNSPLDQNEFRLLRTLLHFVGALGPEDLGLPMTAHPLGKISVITVTPLREPQAVLGSPFPDTLTLQMPRTDINYGIVLYKRHGRR